MNALQRPNILIVDDRPENLLVLEKLLQGPDLNIMQASCGNDALALVLEHDFALVLLDVQMPDMDGYETAELMRGNDETKHIPIIFVTAINKEQKHIFKGYEAGAVDYLFKPVDPDILTSKVKIFLDLHNQKLALERLHEITRLQNDELKGLYDDLAELRHREIEIGARIQQTLLFGKIPENLKGLDLGALTIPSQHIDGDFYDVLTYDDDRMDVILGDVMGKGISAALIGAAVKSQFMDSIRKLMTGTGKADLPEPEAVVQMVHQSVTPELTVLMKFLTLCYARFDLLRQRVILVDCGHPKTIHVDASNGGCSFIEGENLPLGFFDSEIYRQITLPLQRGDVFFFYSDGVIEAKNAEDEMFGTENLADLVCNFHSLRCGQIVENIHREIASYSDRNVFEDDFTCLAVKIGS